MGLRQVVQCGLRIFVAIHVYTRMGNPELQSVETGRDIVDFLFVHLFSFVSLFPSDWSDVPGTLNVLFTCPSCYMAPVLRSRCLLRLVLIYMVLFLLRLWLKPSEV